MVESLQAEVTVCEPIKTATDEIAITKPARVHSLFYFDHSRERPMEAFADTPPEARSQIEGIQNQIVALLSRVENISTQSSDIELADLV